MGELKRLTSSEERETVKAGGFDNTSSDWSRVVWHKSHRVGRARRVLSTEKRGTVNEERETVSEFIVYSLEFRVYSL